MRIGIDARFLTHPQRGGFKTYAEGLLPALAEAGFEHRFTWYTDRPGPVAAPANVRVVPVPPVVPWIGQAVREQALLPRAVRGDGLDLVHFANNGSPASLPVPLVVTIHDVLALDEFASAAASRATALKRRAHACYGRLALRRAARAADVVLTVSESSRRQIVRRLGVDPSRVVVAHPGVRAEFRGPAGARPPARNGDGYFLALAGADARKNVGLALRSFAALPARARARARLVVVAAAPEAAGAIRESARRLGIPVTVLQDVDDSALADLYAGCRALLFPSRAEGFGLPVLEAMAAGAPVIACGSEAVREVAGVAVHLVPPDEGAMAGGMARALEDEAFTADLRCRGVRHAAGFTWERCARRVLEAYELAVATPRRAG